MKDVRPTSGLVLSALFNILNMASGAKFLDLFAGTGRVGFEAMKKYSAEVIFVENIRARAEAIKKSGGFVLNLDVRRAVTWLNKHGHKFNYIFADPPYDNGWEDKLIEKLSNSSICDEYTTVIIEASAPTDFSFAEDYGFEIKKVKNYKNNKHVFLTKK